MARKSQNHESYSEIVARQNSKPITEEVDETVEYELEDEEESVEESYFDKIHNTAQYGIELEKLLRNALKMMDAGTYPREVYGGIIADAILKVKEKVYTILTEEHFQVSTLMENPNEQDG